MIRKFLATTASMPVLALGLALAAPAAAQEEPAPLPEMDFGTWGVGIEGIDAQIDPGDNFDAYVNGKWVRENTIPADRQRFGAFDVLAEKSTEDVQTLIRDLVASDPAPGTTARRIVDAYNAYVDVEAIDATGLAPAQPYLQEIFSAPDLNRLVELFEEPGYPGLVSAGVGADARNPTDYAVSIGFNGMGLPDRDYYLVDSESNLAIREAYMDYLATMLGAAGYTDPAAAARAVYAFEAQVAELEWARQMLRIPQMTYNELTREELVALGGDFPVETLLNSGGFAGQDRFLASQLPPTPEEIEELGLTDAQLGMIGGGLPAMMEFLTQAPLATIKAYMAVRFLAGNASILSSELDEANFDFFGRTIGGAEEQRPRWKRGIGVVQGLLGEQLGALYVERYFPPESKAQMEELVGNLSRSMNIALDNNQWMTPETVAEARNKLNGFVPMVGYPDEFEKYEGLEISATDPLTNAMNASRWRQQDNLAKLGTQVDPSEWGMLPQTVNAYYSPLTNRIVFPAAILQAPFFSADADPAVNYGGIGAVIGHEIGHGYDDQGSQYDATGTLRNWWQDADREGFEDYASRMGALIEAYCPVESPEGPVCLRAGQSMGETLGDVVGLQMAYRAYRLSLNGEEAPVIDGLTGDQRFFLGFGQIWRGMEREESLRNRVMTANHPPGEFRVNNAVRHLDAWYDAFNVTQDDELYLPPEDRIRIW
ncbi:M13 family metallopeptidase [Aurantiacibacter marinus]|uniref:Zinc metalloprotease n=1 Tax=Aurantiacibacter marinus TaxID=874156 RepID=A0A0H0XPQ4_9SPHN|nr:M13 family metallopeptidase [Aurantiacibacter marinus]KLI64603.1 zinc metalloprotease [Aurantiacibacter marinus]